MSWIIDATIAMPVSIEVGSNIGPYKIREQIGEGGMGVVFVAEQTEPIRRKVALKIIKPGMDTKQVIRRFEAERQTLALMDNPNIARVHDAGATETGRPYFVMELVRGLPMTEYCDKHQLSTKDRLALFITVCSAVQHAHLKGIIHRDIKPSNVLVTRIDGEGVTQGDRLWRREGDQPAAHRTFDLHAGRSALTADSFRQNSSITLGHVTRRNRPRNILPS